MRWYVAWYVVRLGKLTPPNATLLTPYGNDPLNDTYLYKLDAESM